MTTTHPPTVLTFVGSLPRMDEGMDLQRLLEGKLFVAVLAYKLLVSVTVHVDVEMTLVWEHLVADSTRNAQRLLHFLYKKKKNKKKKKIYFPLASTLHTSEKIFFLKS